MSQPLILTLRLDAASEKLLTSLRTRFFPRSINRLAAHITLFHALPPSYLPQYTDLLNAISARERGFTVRLKSPFLLGKRSKGVAINVASFKLRQLHNELLYELSRASEKESVQLTDQDQAKLRPHITVQNKVGEVEAQRTMDILSKEWEDRLGEAEGFTLWRYEVDGRWTFVREFDFGGSGKGA